MLGEEYTPVVDGAGAGGGGVGDDLVPVTRILMCPLTSYERLYLDLGVTVSRAMIVSISSYERFFTTHHPT